MKTDFARIKKGAKLLFDMVKPEKHPTYGFICQHPYTDNCLVFIQKTEDNAKDFEDYHKAKIGDPNSMYALSEDNEIVDITIPEGLKLFRNQIFKLIDNTKSLTELMLLLNKTWYMLFIKLTQELMSEQDLGEVLSQGWTLEEYPNRDTNVSKREIIKFFKRADKSTLMDEEEQCAYKSILSKPTLTLYRGVGFEGKPNGLSWTIDVDKARWFANRFNAEHPRVYRLVIDTTKYKKAILAYFDSRNECEVVVDIYKVKNYELIEGADLGGKDYSAKCVIPSTADVSQQ